MNRVEILASCLEEIKSGRSTIEGCLARYPELRDDLGPLLEVALEIKSPEVAASVEFKQRARRHLLQVMQPELQVAPRRGWNVRGWLTPSLSTRALSMALAVIMVIWLLASAGGTVYASQSSLPGDTLYPLKTGLENLQLAVTVKTEDKADLYLKLAEKRADEAATEARVRGTVSPVAIDAVADQIDHAIKEMSTVAPENARTFAGKLAESTLHQQVALGKALETAPAAAQPALQQALEHTRRGNVIAQAVYGNPVFLSRDPSVREKDLDEGRFTIEGPLESINGGNWNVGGIILGNVTAPGQVVSAGTPVKVEGIIRDNRTYIIKVEHDEDSHDNVKIDGTFKGSDQDGTKWNVSGVSVGVTDNKTVPNRGEKFEVSGAGKDGTISQAQVQSKQDDGDKKRVAVEGTLAEVNTKQKLITVNNAGALVRINIGEAKITTNDSQRLSISELTALMGRGVKVDGVYWKGNTFFATEVHVNISRPQGGQSARPTSPSTQDKDRNSGEDQKSDTSNNQNKDNQKDSQNRGDQRDSQGGQNQDSRSGQSRDGQSDQRSGQSGEQSGESGHRR